MLGTLQVLKHSWDCSPSPAEDSKHNRGKAEDTASIARACNHQETLRNAGQGVCGSFTSKRTPNHKAKGREEPGLRWCEEDQGGDTEASFEHVSGEGRAAAQAALGEASACAVPPLQLPVPAGVSVWSLPPVVSPGQSQAVIGGKPSHGPTAT